MLSAPLGIFGGTFDPIHKGHIYPVLEAAKQTDIHKIAMMPCYIPTHKNTALVTSQHRLKMIELVCQAHPMFYPDPRDINRGVPTYSVDSLQELREEFPTTPLCFIIGSDSLNSLPSWHNWQQILNLCHFVVCHREQQQLTADSKPIGQQQVLQQILQERQTFDYLDLHSSLAGRIFIADTQALTMSSTHLRKQIKNAENVEEFIPKRVLSYIHQHKLYQPTKDLC